MSRAFCRINELLASFVNCGRDTMTQTDIDAGRVHVMVGIAPTRPAEFVILRLELGAS